MKEKLATLLIKAARKLCPKRDIELMVHCEPKELGVCYHITKSDVKHYRKKHAEYKSHREALAALIEDTKGLVLGSIAAGLKEKKVIEYEIRKTPYTADVIGTLNVYVKTKEP